MDNSPYLRMPAAFGVPLQNDRFNWYLNSEPEPELNGRRTARFAYSRDDKRRGRNHRCGW
jgi:hypothetical protein